MSALSLLAISASLWALTHFWFVPLIQKGWEGTDLRKKMAKAGLLAATEKFRDLAAVASITLIAVLLLVFVAGLFAESDKPLAQNMIAAISQLGTSMAFVAKTYAALMIWIGIAGAALALFLVARSARSKVVAAWTDRVGAVQERLSSNPNEIFKYSDDPELGEVVGRTAMLLQSLEEAPADSAEEQQLVLEVQQIMVLLAVEIARKELDVEEVLAAPANPESDDKAPLLIRAFASKSLAQDLELANRPLSMVATALLIVSLLGWSAEPLANSLRLAINNLEVNSLQSNVQRELDAAIESPEIEDEVDDEEFSLSSSEVRIARATSQVARVALQQMAQSGLLERSAGTQLIRGARSEFVRAAILRQEINSPASRAQELRAATVEVVNADAPEPRALLRQIESEIRPTIERVEQKDARLLTQLHRRLEQRYGTPMRPIDAQGNLISRIVGQSFTPATSGLQNELAKQGGDIAKEIGEKAVSTWAKTRANGVITETLVGQARAEVVANLQNSFQVKLQPETEALVRRLSTATNQHWGPPASELANQRAAREIAQNVARLAPQAERAAILRNLGGYSQVFPHVAQGIAQGVANAIQANGSPRKSTSSSFRMASRSFRVRGVLFGRDLEAEPIEIQALDWKIDTQRGNRVELSVLANGKKIELGTYNAGTLNQAIRYAADQRVIATTITPGDGKIIARVTYLHPALSDTPLGCRVIEADRIIDSLTFDQENAPVHPKLRDVARDRAAISTWLGLAAIAEQISGSRNSCPANQIQELFGQKPEMSDALATKINVFADKELQQGVSTELIKRSLTCARDPSSAGQCMCEEFSNRSLASSYWFPEDHTSQVREKEATLDAKYNFMKKTKNHRGQVDLWLHTTFAVRSGYDGTADESTATPLDFSEAQLARVNSVIKNELIDSYIQKNLNMDSKTFMEPLEEFIILQRFVRAAFNDQLGPAFPLNRLIELEKITKPFVEYQPTIRWEPAGMEFFEVINQSGDEARSFARAYAQDIERRTTNSLATCGPTKNLEVSSAGVPGIAL